MQRVAFQNAQETWVSQSRTQVDVSFPEPGVMAVTARTDSVSDEQRCWLGRLVIDSTATDERPRR